MVGAKRASIMVVDDAAGVLRTVAARGFGVEGLAPVPLDDDCSVAAKVYREQRIIVLRPRGGRRTRRATAAATGATGAAPT